MRVAEPHGISGDAEKMELRTFPVEPTGLVKRVDVREREAVV